MLIYTKKNNNNKQKHRCKCVSLCLSEYQSVWMLVPTELVSKPLNSGW